ncbi:MAG TPA: hypothetical protein VFY79_11540 [Dehalococcoidia bacterium]|nr:hypothetical protein [Dehalococcoidia bacterium]
MTRKRWLAVAAGGVAAAALIGAGVVMAQTPTPGSGGSGPSFLDRVAQKLGIQSSKLQDAVNSAANDQIDAEVQSGKLSQQQADKLKQQVQNGEGPWFNGPAAGRGPSATGIPGLGFALGKDVSDLAAFLGISTDQLKTELRAQGATLTTVASNHGKTRDQLKTFITDTAKSQLDQAVSSGKLTQKQEDSILSGLQSHLDTLVDAPMPPFGGAHGRFGHNRGDDNGDRTPPAGTTPSAGTEFGGPRFELPSTSSALRS